MKLLSKIRVITLVALLLTPCLVFSGTFMATYNGWDAPGRDYDVIETISASVCKSECNADNKCVAFTLNKASGKCWLKSIVGDLSKIPEPDAGSVVFGIKTISYVRDVDRPGMDYRSLTLNHVNDCSQFCYRDEKCKAFTFNKESNMCNLKSGVPNPIGNSAGISGVK